MRHPNLFFQYDWTVSIMHSSRIQGGQGCTNTAISATARLAYFRSSCRDRQGRLTCSPFGPYNVGRCRRLAAPADTNRQPNRYGLSVAGGRHALSVVTGR
jgi:hypothetical protein